MANEQSLEEQLPVFLALSSRVRLAIMREILNCSGINMQQISRNLDLPLSTLSPHIARLRECRLIRVEDVPATRGVQKRCFPDMEYILIDFARHSASEASLYQAEIPVGSYSDFDVTPTCGLASEAAFLGALDEPRLFCHPERRRAQILWFTTGYVEYLVPNFIPRTSQIDSLTLSFEISSEAPRYNNNWPSTIEFYLNGVGLGSWVCPGDFGGRPGAFNPPWWYDFLNQYGMLKKLTINRTGTFLDSEMLSPVTVEDLNLTGESVIKLRFQVPAGTSTSHGLTLYGQGFGDFNQGIRVMIHYSMNEKEEQG